MKKFITAALTAALLAALSGTLAGEAGTASDPLITKEYAGEYGQGLRSSWEEKADAALEPVYDMFASRFDKGETNYSWTSGQEHFFLASGGSFNAGLGCGVTVLSGAVKVTYSSGSVIDIAAGSVVPSGTALTAGRRYFCAEETAAVFAASSDSALMVDGPYKPVSGMERRDPVPPVRPYDDVAPGTWYEPGALFAQEKMLYRDYDARLFRPEDKLTRVELAYAVWMACGSPESSYQVAYVDQPEAFYLPAVNWCAEKGIMKGTGDNFFGTNDPLNRVTVVEVLFRLAGGSGRDDLSRFTDANQVPDWAQESMSWSVANQIVLGLDERTLAPLAAINRAQVALLLQRMDLS